MVINLTNSPNEAPHKKIKKIINAQAECLLCAVFLAKFNCLNILHGEEKEPRKISDFSDVSRILMF